MTYSTKFLLLIMTTICSVVFTSCEKDDVFQEKPSQTIEYYEPCLDWNSNIDSVKQYMSETWQLKQEAPNYALLFNNYSNTTTVTYSFCGDSCKLSMSAVYYMSSNIQDIQYIISEIKHRYNIVLQKNEKNLWPATIYTGKGVIAGDTITILLHSTSTVQSVFYISSRHKNKEPDKKNKDLEAYRFFDS